MVKALKSPAALGLASRLLYVGGRDWAKLTNWEKINVSAEGGVQRRTEASPTTDIAFLCMLFDSPSPSNHIKVTLEAQRYRHVSPLPPFLCPSRRKLRVSLAALSQDMKSKAPPRPSDTATPGPSSSVEASMGHHHTPSLTSRQAQRTGVSQERLRARWA